jgi:very-short-patch-repair endonuclease
MPKANEAVFFALVKRARLPEPVTEHRFHPTRKHRMDFAWPAHKLALEVEGGVWSGGKHGRGSGIVKDMEKSSLAAAQGWRIIRVTPSELCSEGTIQYIKDALQWRVEEST